MELRTKLFSELQRVSADLHIPTDLSTLSETELIELRQAIISQQQHFDNVFSALNALYDDALQPLRTAVSEQEQRAIDESHRAIHIVLTRPSELGRGFHGQYQGRHIYIETSRHIPSEIPGTVLLEPLVGEFVRHGTIDATNAFGTHITIPRYIDAPHDERNRLAGIRSSLRHANTLRSNAHDDAMSQFIAPISAVLDELATEATDRATRALNATARSIRESAATDHLPSSQDVAQDISDRLATIQWDDNAGHNWERIVSAVESDVLAPSRSLRQRLAEEARQDILAARDFLDSMGVLHRPQATGHIAMLRDFGPNATANSFLRDFDDQLNRVIKHTRAEVIGIMHSISKRRMRDAGVNILAMSPLTPLESMSGNVVVAGRSHDGQMELFDISGTSILRRVLLPNNHPDPSFLIRGQWIVVSQGDDAFAVPSNGNEAIELTPNRGPNWPPVDINESWQIGNRLVYLRARPRNWRGNHEHFLEEITSHGDVQPVSNAAYRGGHSSSGTIDAVISDSERVLFAYKYEDRYRIFALSRESGGLDDAIEQSWRSLGYRPRIVAARNMNDKLWILAAHPIADVSAGPAVLQFHTDGTLGPPIVEMEAAQGRNSWTIDKHQISLPGGLPLQRNMRFIGGQIVIAGNLASDHDATTSAPAVVGVSLSGGRIAWIEHDTRDIDLAIGRNVSTELPQKHVSENGINHAAIAIEKTEFPIMDGEALIVQCILEWDNTRIIWVEIERADQAPSRRMLPVERGAALEKNGYLYLGQEQLYIVEPR